MKLIRTAKIKLQISAEELLPTLQAYSRAFNFVCQEGFKKKCFNGVILHNLTYQQTRAYLPSQLACSARTKATEALVSVLKNKKNKFPTCPQSNEKSFSIRYDKNSYTLFLERKEVSLLTTNGRKRLPFRISAYHENYFQNWRHTSADLVIRKNKVFLHVVFEKEIEDPKGTGAFVGIDRGINNIAVTSNNKFFGGRKLKHSINKFRSLRRKLQKKGTKSAKRHLRKLSGQERRFRADINHQISKQIIGSLNQGDTLVFENLTGIRNKRLRKPQRTLINGWSFFQLEQFLIYKAAAKGMLIEFIDPRYTSQRCSKCGHICRGNRKSQAEFCCQKCGFKLHADLNASRNVVIKHLEAIGFQNGAVVNQPIVSDS